MRYVKLNQRGWCTKVVQDFGMAFTPGYGKDLQRRGFRPIFTCTAKQRRRVRLFERMQARRQNEKTVLFAERYGKSVSLSDIRSELDRGLYTFPQPFPRVPISADHVVYVGNAGGARRLEMLVSEGAYDELERRALGAMTPAEVEELFGRKKEGGP